MCGRFFLNAELKEVKERFKVESVDDYRVGNNIAPTQEITIIKDNKIQTARWGLHTTHEIINARSETYKEKFPKAVPCIVPASGFIEWNNKNPFKVTYDDDIVGFEAIIQDDQVMILTENATSPLDKIHDRQPVSKNIIKKVQPLSKEINNPRNTDAKLLVPIPTLDSF